MSMSDPVADLLTRIRNGQEECGEYSLIEAKS